MLSFMRDQNPGDLAEQKANADASKAYSGSPGNQQEQDYLTVATHGREVRKGTMILLVLFIAGLICLWFMIKKSTPQAATAADAVTEETQIETAITRLTGIKSEMYNRMDEIVSKFYEFSDVLQVQVSELVKNPFQLEAFLANIETETVAEEPVFEIDAETLRRQRIRQNAKDMQLVSIMQSNQGMCCMIDNKILYQGDSIRDFKVCQIGDDMVKLESEGVEVVLILSE